MGCTNRKSEVGQGKRAVDLSELREVTGHFVLRRKSRNNASLCVLH